MCLGLNEKKKKKPKICSLILSRSKHEFRRRWEGAKVLHKGKSPPVGVSGFIVLFIVYRHKFSVVQAFACIMISSIMVLASVSSNRTVGELHFWLAAFLRGTQQL